MPPTTPLENPADATVPRVSLPPGTPFATPEPNATPWTEPLRAAPAPSPMPGVPANEPTAAMVAGRLALGLGRTPSGSPKPPVLGVGATVLLATSVGVELLNMPTLGCGGGVTALGGAGATLGIGGVGTFTSATFGGSTGLGGCILILGGASIFGGGGITFTLGTGGGIYGLGGSTGNTSAAALYFSTFTW